MSDRLAIVLLVVILTGIAALAVTGHWGLSGIGQRSSPNFGFGAGWHCAYPARGEPICVKDTGNQ